MVGTSRLRETVRRRKAFHAGVKDTGRLTRCKPHTHENKAPAKLVGGGLSLSGVWYMGCYCTTIAMLSVSGISL